MGEWKECKLEDVAEVQTGPFGSQLKNEQYITGGTPVITVEHINNFRIVDFDYPSVTDKDKNRLSKYLLRTGDIVFTRVGSVDLSAYIKPHQDGWMFSSRMLRVRPNQRVDPRFLSYFFQQQRFREYILNISVGATMPSINTEILKGIPVSYPPLPKQKAIASVLSSLDDKIDLLHGQNKTLEAMAETLFRQWFVEEAKTDDNVTLGEFSQNVRINARIEDLQKYDHYVGLEHIPRKSIALTTWSNPDELESNKSVFTKGDILFGKLRSYFHKVVFAPIDGVCSTDILVIRPKKKEWFSFCLFWFFNKDMVEHSDLGSGGTRMPRTNWGILSSYQIPRPDLKQIEIFDKIIRPATNKITFNIKQIRTLEELRDTLLPKLMSSEVMVKYDEN